MIDILKAILITIKNEGGYVDNPNDRGGSTKYGITQRDLDASMPGLFVEELTAEQASHWYQTTTKPERYNNPLFGEIVDQNTANKIFDMGVVFGVGTAARLAQAVLGVHQSEIFDEPTLLALNERGASFLEAYKARLVVHAKWIPTQDATQREFVDGWVNRINS